MADITFIPTREFVQVATPTQGEWQLSKSISATGTTILVNYEPLNEVGASITDDFDIQMTSILSGKRYTETMKVTAVSSTSLTVVRGVPRGGLDYTGAAANATSHASGTVISINLPAITFNAHDAAFKGVIATGGVNFDIGKDTDVDISLRAANGDANKPYLRYDSSSNAWVMSNDGTSDSLIGGGISPSGGDGITVTAGVVAVDVSDTTTFVKTSSGAGDEDKSAILNASGKLADGFQSITAANGTTLTDGSNADLLHTHVLAPNIDYIYLYNAFTFTMFTGTVVNRGYATQLAGVANTDNAGIGFTVLNEGIDWDRDSNSEMNIILSDTTSQDAVFGMVADQNPYNYNSTVRPDRHICFAVEDGTLIASCANGTTQSKSTISGIILTNWNTYKIIWNNATSALFYINGILKATLNTNLPSGAIRDSGLRATLGTRTGSSRTLTITHSSYQQITL